MDSDISSEKIRIRQVVRNTRENRVISTLYFNDDGCARARPGQFVMVWEPGFDEMPMSLSSYSKDGTSSITVKPWGAGSIELIKEKRGALIGIRGPYGNGFTVERCNALLVGGGTGLAPLLPLAKELVAAGSGTTVIIGGKSKPDLLFEKQLRRIVRRKNLFVTTDDGSYGHMGFATDIAEDLAKERRITRVYTCGPEMMMRKLYDMSQRLGLEFEASLERGMKCGFGICGSCVLGRYLLCRDGPILDGKTLGRVLGEFGLLQRDRAGRYIKV